MREQIIKIDGIRYYADRPQDCRNCRFWMTHKEGCRLGKNNCYFLAQKLPKAASKCDACPYTVGGACVSASCYRELRTWLEARRK